MYTVTITNLKDNRKWGPVPFDTLEAADIWLAEQKLKSGRKDIRIISAESGSFDEADVLSESFPVINGVPVRVVTLKAEALYEVEDISKQIAIGAAYKIMVGEVYAQMALVFGTTDANSATAYERTWTLMATTPSDWSSAGLKDDNNLALDTAQKIADFATAKLVNVNAYGIWRMTRIQQFKDERAAILAS